MNAKEIERELDMIYFRLNRADQLTLREYEVLQNANRLRYCLLSNHALTVSQRIEALFLTREIFVKDINNPRMKKRVDEAIGFAYANMAYLGPGAFADIIGTNQARVSTAYSRYQQQERRA